MLEIDRLSRTPINEQLIEQFERLALTGIYRPGEPLPSVRALSQELSVNPNTIQKAFNELEARGICFTVPGTGRYFTPDCREKLLSGRHQRLNTITDIAKSLCEDGIPMNLVVEAVEKGYGQAEKGDKL